MFDKLIYIVKVFYKELYNEEFLSEKLLKENIYEIAFNDDVIKVDKSVGNKYRLWFSDYVGTIDLFRENFDDILGFIAYCCDTSNFVDLTESFISKIYNYLVENNNKIRVKRRDNLSFKIV